MEVLCQAEQVEQIEGIRNRTRDVVEIQLIHSEQSQSCQEWLWCKAYEDMLLEGADVLSFQPLHGVFRCKLT